MPKASWEYSAAKDLLRNEIIAGNVTPAMTARVVYDMQPEYSKWPLKRFGPNLKSLREALDRDNERMAQDCAFYGHDRALLATLRPAPTEDKPVWHLSDAQALLVQDVTDRKHEQMKPNELHQSRPQYLVFPLKKFRNHIYQEVDSRAKKGWRYAKKQAKKKKHRAAEAAAHKAAATKEAGAPNG
jgi:hypothetical protein